MISPDTGAVARSRISSTLNAESGMKSPFGIDLFHGERTGVFAAHLLEYSSLVLHQRCQVEDTRDIDDSDCTDSGPVLVPYGGDRDRHSFVGTASGSHLYGLVFFNNLQQHRAIVVSVDDPAVLHPYPVPVPGFCRYRQAVDQFMDGKDDGFEFGCFSAAGECIAVHRNTSILWSFSIQMKVVEWVIRDGESGRGIFKKVPQLPRSAPLHPKHFHFILQILPRENPRGPDSMKITIIGGGYVGLVTGACFAESSHDVTIVDLDPARVGMINDKQPPIFEPGLESILSITAGKNLRASLSYDSVSTSDLTFICVGTPPREDGSANLTYIESASHSAGTALHNATGYHVVVVKSTVPPGTTETVVIPLVIAAAHKTEDEIGFAMNPEFLREGRAIEDFRTPDRIVIGSNRARAGDLVSEVYRTFPAPVVRTGIAAAEMIKYTSNAFLATKISFANEIGNICKELHIDVYDVMKGVGLDQRIGQKFLDAGAGFGGSCFPKDVSSLAVLAGRAGIEPRILRAVLEVNEYQPHRLVALLEKKAGNLSGKRIAVLGLAFKDNTDDVRDSRAISVIQELVEKGAQVVAFDPMAAVNMQKIFPAIEYAGSAGDALKGADGCLVMTEWPEFSRIGKEFELMAQKIVIEGRRILSWNGADGICW